MYEEILVPLDQSELAEQAVPHAVALADALESVVHLVSVVPVPGPEVRDTTTTASEQGAELDMARNYLRGVRKRIMEQGVDTEWDVAQGDVAEQILLYCEQQDCDLIVMSTHGRSGISRWVYGSIADRVLRHAPVPVLLVRAVEEAQ